MHFEKTIKILTIVAVLAIATVPAFGQDLLTRQAPVDRKASKVDTVALRNIIEREENSAVAQLYSEWSNKYAHRAMNVPDSFRIDLRGFTMPTSNRVVTSNFGRRWGRMHKGLDVKVFIGDTIRAAFDGIIRVVNYEAAGYGNYVVIRHKNGLETIYGHMSKHLVHENQTVKSGTPIGLGGNTGKSTGSHLHFETRLCGVALNPALLFDFRNQDVTADYFMFRRRDHVKDPNLSKRALGKMEEDEEPDNSQASADVHPARTNGNDAKYHKVAKGETLYSISRKLGVSVKELCKINKIGQNMRVRPGQLLKYS